MTAVARRHGRPRRSAFALAVLVAALAGAGVTAGCTDTVVEQAPSSGTQQGGETRREGGETHGGGQHTTPHTATTTRTAPPTTGHFDPNECPTGRVC